VYRPDEPADLADAARAGHWRGAAQRWSWDGMGWGVLSHGLMGLGRALIPAILILMVMAMLIRTRSGAGVGREVGVVAGGDEAAELCRCAGPVGRTNRCGI